MIIRPFKPGEELVLREVFYSSVHDIASRNYSSDQVGAWAPLDYDQEKWIQRIRKNQSFVAVVEGEVAGFSDLQDDGYIDQFYVAGRFSGRGVGSRLMAHIHTLADQRSLPELYSHVSLTAEPFFANQGFLVATRNIVNVKGIELRNATMRKQLHAGSAA